MTTEAIRCASCDGVLDVTRKPGRIIKCGYCSTDNALFGAAAEVVVDYGNVFLAALRQAIVNQLSLEDVKMITHNMRGVLGQPFADQLQYENLAGNTLNTKALSLVEFGRMRAVIHVLVEQIYEWNPGFLLVLEVQE